MRRILAGLALALLIASPVAGSAWRGVHWPMRSVVVVDAVGLGQPLVNAVASWDAGPVHLTIEPGNGGCRFQRDVIRLCAVNAQDAAAWTEYRYLRPTTDGHIASVRISINLAYGAWLPSGNADPGFAEFVLCHELGHALGLSHDLDEPGCMNASDPLPTPASSDLADLAVLYGHAD